MQSECCKAGHQQCRADQDEAHYHSACSEKRVFDAPRFLRGVRVTRTFKLFGKLLAVRPSTGGPSQKIFSDRRKLARF